MILHSLIGLAYFLSDQGLHGLFLSAVANAAKRGHSIAAVKPFKPKFFNPQEFQTLEILTEAIMPGGEYPGAREAKVAQFIDFQTLYDSQLQSRFRSGLAWLDENARRRFGLRFRELTDLQRRELLDGLHFKAMYRSGEEKGREFYRLVRRYTEMGFYSSRAGQEVLKAPVDIRPAKKRAQKITAPTSSGG